MATTYYIVVGDLTPDRIPKLKLLQLVDDEKEGFNSGAFRASHLAIIEKRIIDAEIEAEGYASKRYSVASLQAKKPGAFLKKIKDLAEVALFQRRPPLDDDHIKMREQAISWLKSLNDEADQLGLDSPVAEKTEAQGGHVSAVEGPPSQMDSENLKGF